MTDLFNAVGETLRKATFSDCRRYRYKLEIIWDAGAPILVACMLNPSTADEVRNDPTVERVCRRAKMLGFGGVIILNLFAWRDTEPKDMKAAADPIGDLNDQFILETFLDAGASGWTVLFGWGNHGSHLGRDRAVVAIAAQAHIQPMCLRTGATGQPGHPLYIGYDVPLTPYTA